MAVKIRELRGKLYLVIDYRGKRKTRVIGTDRKTAEEVRRQVEAKLVLGDLGLLNNEDQKLPTFGVYADKWIKNYANIECKRSTAEGYDGVLRQYLLPRFTKKRLDEIKRDDVKELINELIAKGLSRNTIRNVLCVIRGIVNQAIEDGLIESNPAARLGRFTRSARTPDTKGVALTQDEALQFLRAADDVCPEFHPLFLTALRAGLRRGELVALQWGDIQFGGSEDDPNRFIVVQHNYVRREHTTTKSKKPRRVDLSKQLRDVLLDLREQRLLASFLAGKNNILSELVFPSPDGSILDPDNLYHRYFQPVLTKAGIRKIRLHDLRHTFGSLLIQAGASLAYVKEQMGHSSIQVTVDIYGHLVPGANISFVDRLDSVALRERDSSRQKSANRTQTPDREVEPIPSEVVDLIGGGGWTRTSDLRIMRPSL